MGCDQSWKIYPGHQVMEMNPLVNITVSNGRSTMLMVYLPGKKRKCPLLTVSLPEWQRPRNKSGEIQNLSRLHPE